MKMLVVGKGGEVGGSCLQCNRNGGYIPVLPPPSNQSCHMSPVWLVVAMYAVLLAFMGCVAFGLMLLTLQLAAVLVCVLFSTAQSFFAVGFRHGLVSRMALNMLGIAKPSLAATIHLCRYIVLPSSSCLLLSRPMCLCVVMLHSTVKKYYSTYCFASSLRGVCFVFLSSLCLPSSLMSPFQAEWQGHIGSVWSYLYVHTTTLTLTDRLRLFLLL